MRIGSAISWLITCLCRRDINWEDADERLERAADVYAYHGLTDRKNNNG